MLSVLVWLAMWGQPATVTTSDDTTNATPISFATTPAPCDEGVYIMVNSFDKVAVCHDGKWVRYLPPAEHVIEIKTVRAHPDHETSDWRECGADDEVVLANAAINGIFAVICRSTKVTRELWIDGQKFGVIKGLDDH